jgi:hypothetical protein
MTYNVGFDFDGVIHKSVTKADMFGQRHPSIPFDKIPDTPFSQIIDLIKIYHANKYNIYIITARPSIYKNLIKNTIIKFGLNKYISDSRIITTGDSHNGDKVETLEKLNIIDFYDDSIIIFKSIKKAKNRNMLKKLKNCYLTIPENNEIIKLNI